MTLNTKDTVILGLVPMGQLWARIFKLNGSLDHKWALMPFFMIPPLQFIPIFMMKFGMFKKGKGGKPYDWFMLIPIIARVLITIFAENFDFPMWVIIEVVLNFLTIAIPYFIRTMNLCKNVNQNNIMNTLTQTAVTQAGVNLFTFLIGFIPIIGIVFSMAEMIPYIGPLLPWTIGYSTAYLVINMYNGDTSKLFCGKNRYKLLYIIVSLCITTVLKALDF